MRQGPLLTDIRRYPLERNIVVSEVVHRRRLLRLRALVAALVAVTPALVAALVAIATALAATLATAATAILLARRLLALRTIAAVVATTTATAFTAAAQHLHFIGDDVGGVLLHAVLAGVLVVAQAAFDVDRAALAQVLAGDLAELAEEHHAVPFGALLLVAILVLADAGGGQADAGDRHAALGVLHVRVVAEIADQDDFVDAARHRYLRPLSRGRPPVIAQPRAGCSTLSRPW